MKNKLVLSVLIATVFIIFSFRHSIEPTEWIRINQLGYTPEGIKVAVWCGKGSEKISSFYLVEEASGKTVFTQSSLKNFGAYGPFEYTCRLNFSMFKKPGRYYLKAGNTTSPIFTIGKDVYKGTADFCLQYMRQQRSGFNPFLKDSCHTHDGYTLYGEKVGIKDSTYIDVTGGWHDASDYLQYATTSANATYHLLMAYRDFPGAFTDEKQANGLDGKNGMADVLDEAKWGLDWLLKMHPQPGRMFNQLGDDRDHMGMRIPKEDSFYGRGFQRPVYFLNGEPQQRGKFMNNTTGTSSTAGKFSSAFGLGSLVFKKINQPYAATLDEKAGTALAFALQKLGVAQTASVRSPYIYAEDNWVDDMELANAMQLNMLEEKYNGKNEARRTPIRNAMEFAAAERVSPWLGADTAKHYQWYPFINIGHYELARQLKDKSRDTLTGYYKEGIQKVWNKARSNAFYRGIPFVWCSNNFTTAFAIQCYWYRQLTGDNNFAELEQANIDWLFGCNPWGTSMVYGLPSWGDTPVDPHSAFTHLKQYPIDGGLVDGPVYTSIYKSLIGIQLQEADEYAAFQSGLAVYHDDYGDYSTNEPTMDGTASLIYLLAAKEMQANAANGSFYKGALVRGNTAKKEIALVFTGDEFADGGKTIAGVLKKQSVKASFFFTGNFYRNKSFQPLIQQLHQQGNYLGPHSDQHLLYCDWNKRDSLLVNKIQFTSDLTKNLEVIKKNGIPLSTVQYFLPPYEWYNDSIAAWTKEMGMQLINYSPGTLSAADYTWPGLKNYRTTNEIYQSVLDKEAADPNGLNGFILLLHIGTDPKRTDKFYYRLNDLITTLKQKGYRFKKLDEMLQ